MKNKILTLLKYLLFLSVGFTLIWISFKDMKPTDWADLKQAISKAKLWLLIPVFIILLLSNYLRAVRWHMLIKSLQYSSSNLNLLCAIQIGYLANMAVPRLGEILRCTTINKYEKIPTEKLIGTIVTERALDVICLLILSLFTLALELSKLKIYVIEIYRRMSSSIGNGWASTLIILLVLILLFILFRWLFKKFQHHQFLIFIKKIIAGLIEGLMSIRKVENKFLFILYTILMWCCYISSTYIGCLAIEETSHLQISTALVMLTFGTFGIILTPGGLGAYPFAIQKTLALYGINENIGKAAGWLLWLAQFTFNIIFGSIAFILLPFINKNKK
jgi:uncharacterized protein (TIRG00374 family)